MRLAGAMLFVIDLEAMTVFYRDVIGFRVIEATRQKSWVEFDTGQTTFALHAIPEQIVRDMALRPSPKPRETAGCKLILEVENADKELDRLNAAGVTILQRLWGGWDFADPEGNVLGVREKA